MNPNYNISYYKALLTVCSDKHLEDMFELIQKEIFNRKNKAKSTLDFFSKSENYTGSISPRIIKTSLSKINTILDTPLSNISDEDYLSVDNDNLISRKISDEMFKKQLDKELEEIEKINTCFWNMIDNGFELINSNANFREIKLWKKKN